MFRKKFGFDNQSRQKPNESAEQNQNSKEGKSINCDLLSDVLE
ncbi:hypothetical protein [Cyclobacterium jeungdonense]|nr:hypothetical protein [Cyclobacterium jeungdonense]